MLLKPVISFPSLYLQHKPNFYAIIYLCPGKIKRELLGVRRWVERREDVVLGHVRAGSRKPGATG